MTAEGANGEEHGRHSSDTARKVDFHVHILHEKLVEIAADKVVINGFGARKPAPRPVGSRRHENFRLMLEPDFHLLSMNKRQSDLHVLSTSSVLQGTAWAEPASDLLYCRMMNDRMAEWVQHAPSRFVGSMVLPLQDMRASLGEMTRCIETYGFKIVHAPTSVKGAYLGDSYFEDYWRAVSSLNVLTYIHPEGVEDPWFQNYSLWNSVGQPIEEAKVMASMIYGGVFDRFPEIQVIVSHGGGYLPHYIGRLDRNVTNMPETVRNISRIPSEYLRMFYYDTCLYDPRALHNLASNVGADRVVLGSDFPFGDFNACDIVTRSQLEKSEKSAIIDNNAIRLLERAEAI
jgi:aminocarboxymuconate-semialdehyde decarboxylase